MFKDKIARLIEKETKLENVNELLEIPPDTSYGDYAFPCFTLAKTYKKPPQEIAGDLKEKLEAEFLEKTEVKGPYLNFFVKKSEKVKEAFSEKTFNVEKEKIMIEFGQPNTHKEFHIGHLRNHSLGDSLVRLNRKIGKEIISANYPGDIGTHVAKTLWLYLKKYKGKEPEKNKGKFLGKIYVEATNLLKENPEYQEEISEILQKLENREPEITELWEETRKWSLDELEEIYEELGIKFDEWYFESEEENPGKEIAEELLDKGIAEKSEGAVVVDLEEENAGTAIILKSDGTSIYLTKDLSLAEKKFREYDLDKSIYVIDSRQSLHMKQTFLISKKRGMKGEMLHIPYEFVGTEEGVFSSRKGNAPLYKDVRDKLIEKLERETRKRHSDWTEEKIKETAKNICIAALKFGMLKVDNNREITFNEEKWLDFNGETGPYILYTYARIQSILKKNEKGKETDYKLLDTKEDEEIIKMMLEQNNVIEKAALTYKPHLVARHSLELAQKANEYYHKHNINKAKQDLKDTRLKLLEEVSKTLKENLELIGINVLEEM